MTKVHLTLSDASLKDASPAGCATALIAVISGKQIHDLGFLFAILPVGIGAMVLLFVDVIFNYG